MARSATASCCFYCCIPACAHEICHLRLRQVHLG
jgi:hypothetical protein